MFNQLARLAIIAALLSAASIAQAQIPTTPTPTAVNVAVAITTSTEGPTADAAGNVYFTEGVTTAFGSWAQTESSRFFASPPTARTDWCSTRNFA